MFLLTRRQAHAALAGAATAAAYLAAAEAGSKRPVRVGGLVIVGMTAMAGVMSSKASVKAYSAHKRIDVLVPAVANASSNAAAAQSTANAAMPKSGGTFTGPTTHTAVTVNTSLDMTSGAINNVASVNSASTVTINSPCHVTGAFTSDGPITGHSNLGLDGKLTAGQIGPGGTRTDLGAGATLAQVQARCDYLNDVLNAANIEY